MRVLQRYLLLALLAIGVTILSVQPLLATTLQEAKKPLTNSDIVRLAQHGISDEQIIRVIQTGPTAFDLSADALIELKDAGISQKVLDAMFAIQPSAPPAATPVQPQPAQPPMITITSTNPLSETHQPYARFNGQADKAVIVPMHVPSMIQTKAKGDNLGTILADDAIQSIASNAISSVAASTILAAPGIAAIPIAGAAASVIMTMPGLRREPTFTYVHALGGPHATTAITTPKPSFELFYGEVVGANPEGFEAVLIKLAPTKNNWRLVGAQKTKPKYFQSAERIEYNFIEERLSLKVTSLGRGHVIAQPDQPLPDGEYGLVLRPISKTYKVSLKDLVSNQGEGVLLAVVWDFSISLKADGQ